MWMPSSVGNGNGCRVEGRQDTGNMQAAMASHGAASRARQCAEKPAAPKPKPAPPAHLQCRGTAQWWHPDARRWWRARDRSDHRRARRWPERCVWAWEWANVSMGMVWGAAWLCAGGRLASGPGHACPCPCHAHGHGHAMLCHAVVVVMLRDAMPSHATCCLVLPAPPLHALTRTQAMLPAAPAHTRRQPARGCPGPPAPR